MLYKDVRSVVASFEWSGPERAAFFADVLSYAPSAYHVRKFFMKLVSLFHMNVLFPHYSPKTVMTKFFLLDVLKWNANVSIEEWSQEL